MTSVGGPGPGPEETTAFRLLQQQVITLNARLDRQIEQLAGLQRLTDRLLAAAGSADTATTFAEAIVEVLDLGVGAVWVFQTAAGQRAEFSVAGVSADLDAWAAVGPTIARRLDAEGRRTASPLRETELAALSGAKLVRAVACRCISVDGSTSALVLAADTPVSAGTFEPGNGDPARFVALLAERVAAHLDQLADRRVIERQLAAIGASEARLARVLRGSSDGWWDWDRETGFGHLSPRWHALVGSTPTDAPVHASTLTDRIHPEDRPAFDASVAHVLEGQAESAQVEVRLRREDGTWLPVLMKGTRSREADGTERFSGTVSDLTERRRLEEEHRRVEEKLRETAKLEALGVLAGGIAHDFNNLLVAIMGNTELARQELPPGSSAARNLESVEAAAGRAADLARQMLAYSGRGRIVVERLALDAMLGEMTEFLARGLAKSTQLATQFEPGLPPVTADATQIRQVALNLIVNASDALRGRPGTVTVRTRRVTLETDDPQAVPGADAPAGDYIAFEVEDDGAGMDAATLARIFDPFFSTKGAGRGLGLAGVLGIVKGHHGTIRVWSEEGRGTRMQVLLPVDPSAAITPPPVAAQSVRQPAGRVLVVDDEPEVREVAQLVLERAGWTVVTAGDGPEAVEVGTGPEPFDAVVLDLTLTTMDGVVVLDRLRERWPSLPIVLCSGWTATEVADRLGDQARTRFVQKPYRSRSLLDAIASASADPVDD